MYLKVVIYTILYEMGKYIKNCIFIKQGQGLIFLTPVKTYIGYFFIKRVMEKQ